MMNKIREELKRRIEAANFEAITITMNCNGDHITITPCGGYGDEPIGWNNIDWFLMDSEFVNFCGGEKLDDIVKNIVEYEDRLAEDERELEQLKAHIRKHGENSDWDFVSDFHKDLFGHRPHVATSQIIAWANSNSKESARYFK